MCSLEWQAIKTMLHPSTSSKIIICDQGDPRLPTDIAAAASKGVDSLPEEAAVQAAGGK